MQIILFFKQALLNNNEDLQFIIFLFICSSLLKIFFISQGRFEINKISSILNFIRLVLFLLLGTLSRISNLYTINLHI